MTQPKIIRWGIAGTGAIAKQFASDMPLARGASLAAVCSRDPSRAQNFAGRQPGVAAFASLSEMIAAQAVDAVYIATPNMAHHRQSLDCIAAGIPVLVEKPLTASLAQAVEIQSAARSANVFVMEAMWSRYLPAIKAARAALRDGSIGTVRRLEADLAWKRDFNPHSRLFDKSQGGGALHDLGVYPISLARYFLGEPDSVSASWRAAPSGVDMSAEVRMAFAGADARIGCSLDRNGANRMVIEGDKGVLVIGPVFIKAQGFAIYPSRRLADLAQPGGNALPARIRRKLFRHLPLPATTRHGFDFPGTGLQFEIEAASNAIRQGMTRQPDNSLDDSVITLRIIETILSQPPSQDETR
ncbi:Gfo/Idh/MocA family oxidoreductase [Hoeflea sp. YIM 152468]|uniref:Gfo/Idh/MocA family protein n=1 Tax=Hoeflea sp. YIM 152468 TaxID=3031759 RepID=UPI0023DB571E|nr:Gfo/Idh/MocA family oxidoreductase [Hoeflea sp. YIM 152468]MDF1609768.1 Gfo/Idh/MocA family oxidoreductase [Hoeflea sp. YIM 152468]